MAQELQNTSPADIHQLRQLLCAPPVLRAEKTAAYDEIFARLMECMAPRDLVEETLVKELADSTWELARYTRYKTLTAAICQAVPAIERLARYERGALVGRNRAIQSFVAIKSAGDTTRK